LNKDAVLDIKFAPKHLGLCLVAAVANGTIKIYRWQDPTNLKESIEEEFQVIPQGECNCLSWNPAFDEPISLLVGCSLPEPIFS